MSKMSINHLNSHAEHPQSLSVGVYMHLSRDKVHILRLIKKTFLATPQGMCNFSFPNLGWNPPQPLHLKPSLNHWPSRKVPQSPYFLTERRVTVRIKWDGACKVFNAALEPLSLLPAPSPFPDPRPLPSLM